jgi:hypothetical protein
MSEAMVLSEERVRILRDIAHDGDAERSAEHHQDLVELIAHGYIERDWGSVGWFKITSKGRRAIDEVGQ